MRTGVNTISCPMIGRRIFDRFVEHRLEGYENGMMGLGYLFGGGPVFVELGEPFVVDRATLENEGLADDQLDLGQGFCRSLDQLVEVFLVGLGRSVIPSVESMPNIVYPNQDAEDVRLELKAVLVPPVGKLVHFVPGDPPVVQGELVFGVGNEQLGTGHPGVAFSEGFLFVRLRLLLVASGIGDGIPLEDHDPALFQSGFGFIRMMTGHGFIGNDRSKAGEGSGAEELSA